jgi:hypothetical protein
MNAIIGRRRRNWSVKSGGQNPIGNLTLKSGGSADPLTPRIAAHGIMSYRIREYRCLRRRFVSLSY